MPNHVHLVMTPQTPDGLARAIGETHRQYTGFVNARARWTGHLFQGHTRIPKHRPRNPYEFWSPDVCVSAVGCSKILDRGPQGVWGER
jgi:REP element-mobilizing transposase RayT